MDKKTADEVFTNACEAFIGGGAAMLAGFVLVVSVMSQVWVLVVLSAIVVIGAAGFSVYCLLFIKITLNKATEEKQP